MSTSPPSYTRRTAATRLVVGVLVILVLLYAYVIGIPVNGPNPFDYFGYFTNLTSLLTSLVLIIEALRAWQARPTPSWLTSSKAVTTACMIIVAVIYNVLVPGTGSAPLWVSLILHLAFPFFVVLDWVLSRNHPPLPWRRLWIVIPYPVVWLIIVLTRGATDGWVPYGFLLPQRGLLSLGIHIAVLLAALLIAGSLVWRPLATECPRSRLVIADILGA